MLRAASWFADHGIPILGINLGRLGFLTRSTAEAREAILLALQASWEATCAPACA